MHGGVRSRRVVLLAASSAKAQGCSEGLVADDGTGGQQMHSLPIAAAAVEDNGDAARVTVRDLHEQQQPGIGVGMDLIVDLRDIQERFGSISPHGTSKFKPLRGSASLSNTLHLDSVADTTVALLHSSKGEGHLGVAQSKQRGVCACFPSDRTLRSSKSSTSNSFVVLSND